MARAATRHHAPRRLPPLAGVAGAACLAAALVVRPPSTADAAPPPEAQEDARTLAQRWADRAATLADRLSADTAAAVAEAAAEAEERLRHAIEQLTDRAQDRVRESRRFGVRFALRAADEPAATPAPDSATVENSLVWTPPQATDDPLPGRVVLLVHGLDEPGSIWDDLAPAIHDAGYAIARFDYPNDQHPADSARLLGETLAALRERGVGTVDLVCHSMGGLIARDVLTRPEFYAGRGTGHDDLPDVARVVTLGTPLHGAPLARLRLAGEVRDQVERWLTSDTRDLAQLLGGLTDGSGEAGKALLPGSPYLEDLRTRALPEDVAFTAVVANASPAADHPAIERSLLRPEVKAIIGQERSERLAGALEELRELIGDGAVPGWSARPEDVEDVVHVEANHRSMVKVLEVERALRRVAGLGPAAAPGVEIVLDRLAREAKPDPGAAQPKGAPPVGESGSR